MLFVFAIAVSSLVPYITDVFRRLLPARLLTARRHCIAVARFRRFLQIGAKRFRLIRRSFRGMAPIREKQPCFRKTTPQPLKSDCLLQKHRRFCHTFSCDASLTLTGATVYRRFLSCVRMAQRCRKLEDKQQNPVSRTPSKTVSLCARSNGRPVLCMHAAFCKAPP